MDVNRQRRAFKVGGSFQAPGTVLAEFKTREGLTRYVFEFDCPKGMLHIYTPEQLEFDVQWYIRGDEGEGTFPTKMDAEVYARKIFPNEDEDIRYSRIYFRNVEGS